MPVTSLALLLISAVSATGLTLWAISAWGATTVLPLLAGLALFARWAMADVPFDDGQT